MAGYEIWYNKNLKFKHFLTRDRLTWDYYWKFIAESSGCFEVLDPFSILAVHKTKYHQYHLPLKLSKVFFYYLRKIIPVLVKKACYSSDVTEGIINRIHYKIFTTRLHSIIFDYKVMKDNYRYAIKLKERLNEPVQK